MARFVGSNSSSGGGWMPTKTDECFEKGAPHVWIPVIIESPYAGDIEANLKYLRKAMRDCLARGETPYASHALLTQPGVLDDSDPEERAYGIQAGFAWREYTLKTVVYIDRGFSTGMKAGIAHAIEGAHPIEFRSFIDEGDLATTMLPREEWLYGGRVEI